MAIMRLIRRISLFFLVGILASASGVWGKPTTPEQARGVVQTWLAPQKPPLGISLPSKVKEVVTFADESGLPLYFVVYLDPEGMVFVPADDLVEPIVGFAPSGVYVPSPANTLGAMVSLDLSTRVRLVREMEATTLAGEMMAASPALEAARRKWAFLTPGEKGLDYGLNDINEILVGPLMQSEWGQDSAGGGLCYNLYTPNHYLCGCTATALAQFLYCLKYPTTGIGTAMQYYYVDNQMFASYAPTRGGNGLGGPYQWDLMINNPNTASLTDPQRQAIGALTFDTAITIHSTFTVDYTGAKLSAVRDALASTFKFSNAIFARFLRSTIPAPALENMINANLDFKYPVFLGITGGVGNDAAHTVVCDGYGYNFGTRYHHLNLGNDDGVGNLWYNLPLVDGPAGTNTWTMVEDCVYNIFKTGNGEIISGRVTDISGNGLSNAVNGATVTIVGGGATYIVPTDAKGIYAVAMVPSNTTFTLTATATGYTFTPQTVTTGESISGGRFTDSVITGNVWGVNFRSGLPTPVNPKYRLYSLAQSHTSCRAFAIGDIHPRVPIVGAAKTAQGAFHAFLWLINQDDLVSYQDLGTFPEADPMHPVLQSEAHGINNNGLVVGWSNKQNSNNKYPCYWNILGDKAIYQLATANANANAGQALGVNNKGEIVGTTWFYPPDAMLWACFWQNVGAAVSGLTAGTGSPRANRINDQSVSVGAIDNKAARWDQGIYSSLDPSGTNSEAFAPRTTNFPGAVGQKNGQACIFYSPDNIVMLGSLGGTSSTAYKVNNSGQIVGQATNSAGRGRAFIWDPQNGMQDLNALVNEPDWVLNTAYDINDRGEIVGWGYFQGIYDFAFILRPLKTAADMAPINMYLLD
jgi:probable HAF family extracellular repeat protein